MSLKKKIQYSVPSLFPFPTFPTLPHPPHPQTKYRAQTPKLEGENSQSGNQQIILTQNTKLNAMPKFTWAATREMGNGAHLNTLQDPAHTGPALQRALPSAPRHRKGRLSVTPEAALFLPSIGRLDPGYKNAKRSTNIKSAQSSDDFFFPFPFQLKGETEKKNASCGFLSLTYNKFH